MNSCDVIMGVIIINFFFKCAQRVILLVCIVSLSFHISFLSYPPQGFERQKKPRGNKVNPSYIFKSTTISETFSSILFKIHSAFGKNFCNIAANIFLHKLLLLATSFCFPWCKYTWLLWGLKRGDGGGGGNSILSSLMPISFESPIGGIGKLAKWLSPAAEAVFQRHSVESEFRN